MKLIPTLALLLSGAVLLPSQGATVPAWPMFRGPNGSGVAETAHPPVQFGTNQHLRWSTEVPGTPSSPAVWGDRIFLTTFAGNQLETRAYDRANGRPLWTGVAPAKELEEFMQGEGSPASSTPATDGEVVVSYFGSAGLFAYDLQGHALWQHPFPPAQTFGGFGSGTSPLIVGDRVLLVRDVMNGPELHAFDRRSGKPLWTTPRSDSRTSYSAPILWRHDGIEELIVAGSLAIKAYDPASGAERWQVRGIPVAPCTTPVAGDGLLYFAGWAPGKADAPMPTWESLITRLDKNHDGALGPDEFDWGPSMFRTMDANKDNRLEEKEWNTLLELGRKGENVLLAIKPGARGDATDTHVAWKATRGLPYVASPLYYAGRIFIVKDGGMISAFDARTGEAVYQQERLPDAAGSYYASPVAADGRVYLASLQGKVTVLDAKADKPTVLHQAAFGERIAATPALVEDQLYLRTATRLHAFGN